MRPRFREDKATQVASLLLQRAGGEINYMKLLKLMYLIEREGLVSRGRPVAFDALVSMDHGPVLSQTLDLINEGKRPGEPSIWKNCISNHEEYSVQLNQECNPSDLSDSEIETVHWVWDEFGHLGKWDLVDLLHTYPEWEDPEGSSIPLRYEDILRAVGMTASEISSIKSELEELAFADQVFG